VCVAPPIESAIAQRFDRGERTVPDDVAAVWERLAATDARRPHASNTRHALARLAVWSGGRARTAITILTCGFRPMAIAETGAW
jgi:hypothetical protein